MADLRRKSRGITLRKRRRRQERGREGEKEREGERQHNRVALSVLSTLRSRSTTKMEATSHRFDDAR